MIRKQIVATSDVDKQNQRISLEALTEYAYSINSSPAVLRMGINHDVTVLPIGKIIAGTLKTLESGETALEVEIDDFIDDFSPCTGPNGEELCFAESKHDLRPFVDYESESEAHTTVMLNPLDFSSAKYNELVDLLVEECSASIQTTISKSFVPVPTVIILLASGFLTGTFFKSVATKTVEKLSDAISDDLVKVYAQLKKIIRAVAGRIISGKQVVYIFSEAQSPIELVVKARNADAVEKAFMALEYYNVDKKVEQFRRYTNGGLKKIQFVYDDSSEKWEMSYLTTNTGSVIGTMKNHERSVKMYQEVMQAPSAGFSIAGSVSMSEENNDG